MRIGHYETLGELGRGGMGVVYRARSPEDRDVAVKVVLDLRDRDALATFERERRLLATLGETEGFVPILDSGVAGGHPYLVMPFLAGGTLRARIAAGPLPTREAIALVTRLARTVGGAHGRGIVHRDLKPENVLFTGEGEPLVADLGLAKHFRRDVAGASRSGSISATGTMAGTPGYLAPEQIDDSKHVGPPADVFALGVILQECLTGKVPFPSKGMAGYVSALRAGPDPLSSGCPPWLRELVSRCLANDPAKRFEDGDDLARALQAGAARGTRRARHAAVAAAAVLTLAGAAASASSLVRGTGRDMAPARSAPAPPPTDSAKADAARRLLDEADRELDARRVAGARERLDRAIEADPTLARAFELRGYLREDEGDYQGTIADLTRAITLAPRTAKAFHFRGRAHAGLGERAASLADYGRAIELDPGLADAHVDLATALVAQGDHAGAIAATTRAIELEPQLALAYSMRAVSRRALGDLDGALADLNAAIERPALDPSDAAMSYVGRAEARVLTGDLEGALADYERSLQLSPEPRFADRVRAALSDCRRRMARIEELKPRIEASCASGDVDDAITCLDEFIQLAPRLPMALCTRGSLRLRKGDLEGAIADLTRTIELTPGAPEAWSLRARARLERGELEAAISDVTQAIALAPGDATGWLVRGDARDRKGEHGAAIADLTRAILLDPGLAAAWAARGAARMAFRDPEGGIADETRAIELEPTLARAWAARGGARVEREDSEGAIADLTRAIELDPRLATAWGDRGAARLARNDLAGAVADLTRALELVPRYPAALLNLGAARGLQGDRAGAIADFERFLEWAPDAPDAPAIRQKIARLRAER